MIFETWQFWLGYFVLAVIVLFYEDRMLAPWDNYKRKKQIDLYYKRKREG